jgi:ABC-type Fe3+-hydroxamate transport system substrate-binding protein
VLHVVDDTGRTVHLPQSPSRLVSLVPSLTELLFALGAGPRVLGVTRFCVSPPEARRIPRVGGTKNPDLAAIHSLSPDLVLANAEENRREDVERLAAAGIAVYVTFPTTVQAGIALARQLGGVLGLTAAGAAIADRLEAARAMAAAARPAVAPRVFCPIWKRPWMSFNRETFAHDMLEHAGGTNVCAQHTARYPVVDPRELCADPPAVVLLPSEPYRFSRRDLGDVQALFDGVAGPLPAARFIDGRALTWYGPRIDWGLEQLRRALAGT